MSLLQNGTYKIITYGCQMNVHESEKLAGMLVDMGLSQTQDSNSADIVIFNTCCVRETAEQRAYGNIGALKKLKKDRPEMIIAVCGCMTQADGSAERLVEKFPFLDIVFGTHNLHEFERLLNQRIESGKRVMEVWEKEGEIPQNSNYLRDNNINAWVNIMYGCDNFCSYCIVPHVRGRERSRSMEEVLEETLKLVHLGYKEITLLGQNVNSYGKDLSVDGGAQFPKLLEQIASIPQKFRLKFMTSHPKDFGAELIKAIAENHRVSKSIHLPVQSGSSRVLKMMNRGYSREDYLQKIELLKKAVPNCGITTDIMVGFPGETDKDFEDTLSLVRQVEYSSCYSFVYSKRSGTPAASMAEQIDPQVKKERIMRLISQQNKVTARLNRQNYQDKTFEVLTDGKQEDKPDIYCGRTDCGRLINFYSAHDVRGKFVNVKIKDIANGSSASLWGDLV